MDGITGIPCFPPTPPHARPEAFCSDYARSSESDTHVLGTVLFWCINQGTGPRQNGNGSGGGYMHPPPQFGHGGHVLPCSGCISQGAAPWQIGIGSGGGGSVLHPRGRMLLPVQGWGWGLLWNCSGHQGALHACTGKLHPARHTRHARVPGGGGGELRNPVFWVHQPGSFPMADRQRIRGVGDACTPDKCHPPPQAGAADQPASQPAGKQAAQ